MDPSIKGNTTFSQDVRSLAKAQDKKENGPMGQQVSELAHQKKTENVQMSAAELNKKQLNAVLKMCRCQLPSLIKNSLTHLF